MNRLQSELHRLYLPRPPAPAEADAPSADLIDDADRVRAMVLELTRPPSWELLSRIWYGVQADLGLPAPAIAVSGVDGLQLWFSLEEPIAVAQAQAFLESLRSRYLADVGPGRVRLMPASDASARHPERHARPVPARQEQTGNWSAFVAPDLAPVFADTPWLDIPPNEEGQAALLRVLETTKPTEFEAASKQLGPGTPATAPVEAVATRVEGAITHAPPTAATVEDAAGFLFRVMNDASVALALRIEAAKALLQHSGDPRAQPGD
jgi:hypothetical protein